MSLRAEASQRSPIAGLALILLARQPELTQIRQIS
jgi:hypothetical protein